MQVWFTIRQPTFTFVIGEWNVHITGFRVESPVFSIPVDKFHLALRVLYCEELTYVTIAAGLRYQSFIQKPRKRDESRF